jgi:hypothetical protein
VVGCVCGGGGYVRACVWGEGCVRVGVGVGVGRVRACGYACACACGEGACARVCA